jgi:hypothetical protein
VEYARSILVRDANGDEFLIYEFQDRRFLKKVRSWKLDTGEMVEEKSGELVIVRTGERLVRVACG